MELRDLFLKGCKVIYRKTFHPAFNVDYGDIDRASANEKIFKLLSDNASCMITRFGTVEIGIINNYLTCHDGKNILNKSLDYITGNTGLPWWDKLHLKHMKNSAGIFPESIDVLERFAERYLEDIPFIDILGAFNYAERYMPLGENVTKVHLECLYPFFVENPWTRVLEGKKVLVVHPFTTSILQQYNHRDKLFENKYVLPEFELSLIQAVQSAAKNTPPFKDWFDALKYMEDEISNRDFDFCILGCGAYGLPLAAHVKRIGKKAIHLGGGSQLLFGIKGKRWDNDAYHWRKFPQLNTSYSNLYNEYWIRPGQGETPEGAQNIEGACYW